MRSSVILVIAVVAVLLAQPADVRGAEGSDPCRPAWEGERLSASLRDISITVKALELLNGRESPKLRHLLEMNLSFAASQARQSIDGGAVLASPYSVVNSVEPVRRALTYVGTGRMAANPPVARGKSDAEILADLRLVEEWLGKRP